MADGFNQVGAGSVTVSGSLVVVGRGADWGGAPWAAFICMFNSILNTLVDLPVQTIESLSCCTEQFAEWICDRLPLFNVST